MDKNNYLERVNFVREDNLYIGHSVNLPLVCQATSKEELHRKMKIMLKSYCQFIIDNLDKDLDLREVTKEQFIYDRANMHKF